MKALTKPLPGKNVSSTVRLKYGTWLWALAFAIVPVERLFNSLIWSWASTVLVLVLLVANVLIGRRARPFGRAVWIFSFVAILLAGVVSGTHSHMSSSIFVGVLLALELLLAPFVLTFYVRENPRFIRIVVTAFLVSQTLSALVGILQKGGLSVLGQSQRGGRINGLSTHPNVLGVFAALVLILVVYLVLTKHARAISAVLLVGIPNAVALIMTGSLSSLLTFGAGVLVLMISLRGQTLLAIPFVILAGGIGLGLAALAGVNVSFVTELIEERISAVTGQTSGSSLGSAEVRDRTYEFARQYLAGDPWIGVGLDGTNAGTYNGLTVVHNFVLRSWYQGGILMLAFAIVIILLVIRVVILGFRRPEFALQSAILVSIAVYGATSALFNQNQYWLPILLCFATLPGAVSKPENASPSGQASKEPPLALPVSRTHRK